MTSADLLRQLRGQGLTVTAVGDQLQFRPRGRLTPTDRTLVLAHKPALLTLLARERLCEAVLEAAATRGFPRLRLRPGIIVLAGSEAWTRFTTAPAEHDDLLTAFANLLDGRS